MEMLKVEEVLGDESGTAKNLVGSKTLLGELIGEDYEVEVTTLPFGYDLLSFAPGGTEAELQEIEGDEDATKAYIKVDTAELGVQLVTGQSYPAFSVPNAAGENVVIVLISQAVVEPPPPPEPEPEPEVI